jgi:predicted transcriptional regulator
MSTKGKTVHYGQAVKKKLKERGMSVSEFSRRINRSRSDVYDIFKRDFIDIPLLQKISKVLCNNFMRNINQY